MMLVSPATSVVPVLVVVVVFVGPEKPCTRYVHEKPHDGNADGFIEADRHRLRKTGGALDEHEDGYNRETDCAREPAEGAHLAGAEAEARIGGVPSRVHVGEDGHAERRRVRPHVPAVRQQGHRPEREAGHDLGRHHQERDGDDPARAALAGRLLIGPELVTVSPRADVLEVHRSPSLPERPALLAAAALGFSYRS